jgi:CBS domain-containing protein
MLVYSSRTPSHTHTLIHIHTDALAVLSQAHIHAAPIINSDDDSFHGVVTTTELMRFVYFANYSCMQRKESSPFGYRGPQTALPEGVSVNLAAVAGKTLADLDALPYTLQGSPAQPLRTLNLEDSMGKAARLILKGHKIIPVRNSHNGKIVNVVSVSDVLAYIARHKRAPSDRMYGLVESLEVEASDFPDVVTCCTDASVFEALRLLFISGQASVAMIDPHSGTIQGNFSSSDLARVCSENKHATLDLAGLDLKAFLSKYSPSRCVLYAFV